MLRGLKKINNKALNRSKGDRGEDVVVGYLKNNKYKILDRNIRYKNGEIDIVAVDDKVIVCVEVKSQHKKDYNFSPEDHFDYKKIQQIHKVFSQYVLKNNIAEKEQRIDLVSVVFDESTNKAKIKHYKNVV